MGMAWSSESISAPTLWLPVLTTTKFSIIKIPLLNVGGEPAAQSLFVLLNFNCGNIFGCPANKTTAQTMIHFRYFCVLSLKCFIPG